VTCSAFSSSASSVLDCISISFLKQTLLFFSVFITSASTKRVGSSVGVASLFCCKVYVEFFNCVTATNSSSCCCASALNQSEYSLTRTSREGLRVSQFFFVFSLINMLLSKEVAGLYIKSALLALVEIFDFVLRTK
jgi:hypothetical protein